MKEGLTDLEKSRLAKVTEVLDKLEIRFTVQQHREFIDKFILLKFDKGQPWYLYFLLILIVLMFIGMVGYYRRRIKDKDERISELQKEKNVLQNRLLK